MSDTTTEPAILAQVRELTVYRLANMADVGSSDFDHDGAGARFLTSVRDDLIERLTYDVSDPIDTANAMLISRDTIHEIADNAPDVYTFTRWQEFTDLAAWQEDVTEFWTPDHDMERMAGVALYLIAERLCEALLTMITEEGSDSE